MKRWLSRIAIAVLLVVVAVPASFVVRAKYFPPRFAVSSIAALPEYQDGALLAQAWQLPVAKTFQHHVDFQPNGSVCGPTSIANVLRSLGAKPDTAHDVLAGTGRCAFDICLGGLSLDAVAAIARDKSHRRVTVLRDLSLAEFREHMARSNDSGRRYLVNFQRGLLFGQGVGHHSPVAGYLPDRDLVFVLDVNPNFGPWLVPTERLYAAANSLDSESNQKRGLLLIE